MGLESVEAVGPFGMCTPEPVINRVQALELESRRAALTVAAPGYEAGALQHLEVLGDCRLRQRGGFGELDHSGFASRQALEDRSTGGVGEGSEHPAKGVITEHRLQVI